MTATDGDLVVQVRSGRSPRIPGVPDHLATRYALTLVKGLPPGKHLDAVYTALRQHLMLKCQYHRE